MEFSRMKKPEKKQQQGAALVVAMILLTLLTLLGTDSMRNSMLDMNLSKGFRDYNYAFQSAETGLRLAEQLIADSTSAADVSTQLSAGNIAYEATRGEYQDDDYWSSKSDVGDGYDTKIVVQPWKFVPDSLAVGASEQAGGIQYYRVVARGTDRAYAIYIDDGNTEDYKKVRSVVVLQSIYAKRHSN